MEEAPVQGRAEAGDGLWQLSIAQQQWIQAASTGENSSTDMADNLSSQFSFDRCPVPDGCTDFPLVDQSLDRAKSIEDCAFKTPSGYGNSHWLQPVSYHSSQFFNTTGLSPRITNLTNNWVTNGFQTEMPGTLFAERFPAALPVIPQLGTFDRGSLQPFTPGVQRNQTGRFGPSVTNSKPATLENPYCCRRDECTRPFKRRKDLMRHIRTVHEKKQLQCRDCGQTIRGRKDNLKRHRENSCKGRTRRGTALRTLSPADQHAHDEYFFVPGGSLAVSDDWDDYSTTSFSFNNASLSGLPDVSWPRANTAFPTDVDDSLPPDGWNYCKLKSYCLPSSLSGAATDAIVL